MRHLSVVVGGALGATLLGVGALAVAMGEASASMVRGLPWQPLESQGPGDSCGEPNKVVFDGAGNASVCSAGAWASMPGVSTGVQNVGGPCRQEGTFAVSATQFLVTCRGATWVSVAP
jgi:hypothetical protein